MKRKSDESAFEFRKRKKADKLRKEHMYDYEKNYWKNDSAQATRQNKNRIENFDALPIYIDSLFGHKSMMDKLGLFGSGDYNENPQRERTWGEFGTQALAGASGAALGFIQMNVPGAIIGGTLGARAAAPDLEDVMDVDVAQNKLLSLMPGTYQGKFALSKEASSKGLRDKYQKKGAVYITENFGTLADADICYIGHSTYNSDCIRHAIGHAMLRKLFKKGTGLDISTPYEELPLKDLVPSSGPTAYKITYQTRDGNGGVSNYTHDINNDETLETLLFKASGGFSLWDNLNECLTIKNPQVVEYVYLFSHDNVLAYRLDMTKEVLHIAMSSHMVIQNRTKAASDGSASTTQVDAQPLKGPVFEFSVAVPKLKSSEPVLLNVTDTNGLILIRSNQLGGTNPLSYREPPVKATFQNVVKSGYTRLNPGALKSMTTGIDCTGYYANVLYKLRLQDDEGVVRRAYGKSQMACFEEELNSGSANNISLSYECQHIAGAEYITTFKSNMQPGYQAFAVNNVPA
nr:putative capsid protein [Cressdnaviricota sp.]